MRGVHAWLYRAEDLIVGLALGLASVATFLEVIARYVFNASIGTGGELAVFSIIWAAMIGAAIGARSGIHIGVDVLVQKLPPALTKVVVLATLLVSALFTLVVTILGIELVSLSFQSGQVTAELFIPRWLLYCSVPLGMALMTYHLLYQALTQLRRPAEEIVARMANLHHAAPEDEMIEAEIEAARPKDQAIEAEVEAAVPEETRPPRGAGQPGGAGRPGGPRR